jgi:hypothetical protein
MRGMRRAAGRLAGTLLMVALLVVPLIASAHTHRDLRAARSCATCVAAHHSPALPMPVAATGPSIAPAIASPLPLRVVPADLHRSPRAGRAPPAPGSVA